LVINAARGRCPFARKHRVTVIVGKFDRAAARGETYLLTDESTPGDMVGEQNRIIENAGRVSGRELYLVPLHARW
jgi:hypothetical protein